jgi:hypothetical protein
VKIYDVSKTNSASQSKTFNDGDRVSHKLFWPGQILEIRWEIAIVKRDNPRYMVKKIELRYLQAE